MDEAFLIQLISLMYVILAACSTSEKYSHLQTLRRMWCHAPKLQDIRFALLNKKLNVTSSWMLFIIDSLVVQLVIFCVCSAITVKHSNKLFLRHYSSSNKLAMFSETWRCVCVFWTDQPTRDACQVSEVCILAKIMESGQQATKVWILHFNVNGQSVCAFYSIIEIWFSFHRNCTGWTIIRLNLSSVS
jgi:hypothetical protein